MKEIATESLLLSYVVLSPLSVEKENRSRGRSKGEIGVRWRGQRREGEEEERSGGRQCGVGGN